MLSNIFKKDTFVIVGLFILTLALMIIDPFNLNPDGFNGTSALGALYGIPALVVWYFYFVSPTYSKRDLSPAEKRSVLYNKIESVLRQVLTVLGSLMTFGFLAKIPYMDTILSILKIIAENFNIATNSIESLIGIVLLIAGHFYKSQRFDARSLIAPRKINI